MIWNKFYVDFNLFQCENERDDEKLRKEKLEETLQERDAKIHNLEDTIKSHDAELSTKVTEWSFKTVPVD